MIKKFLTGILTAAIIFSATPTFATSHVEVPEDIYKWVQSTPRGNYFFNMQQMNYRVNYDGTINLEMLNVPTICTYDNIQIDDVVQKRRWKMQSLDGYDILAGRADYLTFDLKNETVQIVRRVDIDDTLTELDEDVSGQPIKLSDIAKTDVSCKFYREILKWAREHNDELIKRSKGRLSDADSKLDAKNFPIYKITLPGEDPKPEIVEPVTIDKTQEKLDAKKPKHRFIDKHKHQREVTQ